jgi:lipoate-protein ligase A
MSVDEALLEFAGEQPPTLRLYTWTQPSLSLGYRQREGDWLERSRGLGVEPVRRVSGGGAVLHAGDLTYAVVAPLGAEGVPAGLDGSYLRIRELLLEALHSLELDAVPAAGSAGAERQPACFAGSTGHEIELSGRKLVGSAQRRVPWGFLQHGSIRLRDDSALHRALLGERLRPPAAALGQLGPEVLAAAIERSFAKCVPGGLEAGTLSPNELERARCRSALRTRDALAVLPVSSSC